MMNQKLLPLYGSISTEKSTLDGTYNILHKIVIASAQAMLKS